MIFQPLPVACHTRDLLPVEVGDSIPAKRAVARVHPVLLDAREELGLLDGHGLLDAALEGVEERGAEAGAGEPAEAPEAEGDDAEGEEGVHRHLGQQPVHVDADEQGRARRAADRHREEAAGQLEPPPRLAQREEGVPVERRRRGLRGGGGGCGGRRGGGVATGGVELALHSRRSSSDRLGLELDRGNGLRGTGCALSLR